MELEKPAYAHKNKFYSIKEYLEIEKQLKNMSITRVKFL
jgi:hypothetical protein